MVKINIMTIPLGVIFSKAQSSKLEGLFCHISGKKDFRALSFELWNSIRKRHPTWDWLFFDDWQWIQKCKPIPLGVTFSNAVSSSKIKARTSLFTETWQRDVRALSFELSKMTSQVRESSKRNYYIISPRVMIKAIIIIMRLTVLLGVSWTVFCQ